MRIIIIIFLLSQLLSCTVKHEIVSAPPQTPANAPVTSPKGISLVCDRNCTEAEKTKIKAIEEKLNKTLQSQCFVDYVRAGGRVWNEMGTETPETLITKMREPMILMVNYFYSLAFWVYGYEVAGEPVVHLNRHSIAREHMSLCQEASIAAHEASHAQGFMHRGNRNDDYNSWTTAPYIINHAFDSKSEDYRNGGCCE